jgi:hypothetical protein
MKLLKIVSVIFAIYFFRRFMQMYRAMEQIQRERAQTQNQNPPQANSEPRRKENVIEADFKVVDH